MREPIRLVAVVIAALSLIAVSAPLISAESPEDDSVVQVLSARSGGEVRVAWHEATGTARFLGTDPGRPIPTRRSPQRDPETAARGFLAEHGEVFGITDVAAQLASESRVRPLPDGAAVRFQQEHRGVPVLGGELVVRQDADGGIRSVAGETLPDIAVDVVPTVTASDARTAAVAAVAKGSALEPAELTAGRVERWLYDPVLLGAPGIPGPRLVWRTEVTGPDVDELVLVDAGTGAIALRFSQRPHALDRRVCDFANVPQADYDCIAPVRIEGGPATGVPDVDDVWEYIADFYELFAQLGRDGIDGRGGTIVASVRYCDPAEPCPYDNAFWDGDQIVFGDGLVVDDVVAHELAHGVTEHESNLFYYYQSGAINEALSDVFGEIIDLTNGSADDTTDVRWLLGEGSRDGVIRDMAHPPAYDQPDRMLSELYDSDPADNGGVHINSGVANKAAYLMADGDTFNGVTVTGIGLLPTAAIFHEANTSLLTSASAYADLADALPQACRNLVGRHGIVAGDCTQVERAVAATDMHEPPPGQTPFTAEVCPRGTTATSILARDDLESGTGSWRFTGYGAGDPWDLASAYELVYATSGTQSLFGPNSDVRGEQAAEWAHDIVLPPDAVLHFNHAYEFETALDAFGASFYDGGVLEVSVDGGQEWFDAGDLIVEGEEYLGVISTDFDNPLAGWPAFVGWSFGYGSTRVDLSALAGRSSSGSGSSWRPTARSTASAGSSTTCRSSSAARGRPRRRSRRSRPSPRSHR
jgi:bacillolysin